MWAKEKQRWSRATFAGGNKLRKKLRASASESQESPWLTWEEHPRSATVADVTGDEEDQILREMRMYFCFFFYFKDWFVRTKLRVVLVRDL